MCGTLHGHLPAKRHGVPVPRVDPASLSVQPPGDHPHRGASCHEFAMLVCHSCETTSVFKLLEPYIRHTVGEDTHVNHTGLCIRQTKRNPCKLMVSPAVTRTRPQIVYSVDLQQKRMLTGARVSGTSRNDIVGARKGHPIAKLALTFIFTPACIDRSTSSLP